MPLLLLPLHLPQPNQRLEPPRRDAHRAALRPSQSQQPKTQIFRFPSAPARKYRTQTAQSPTERKKGKRESRKQSRSTKGALPDQRRRRPDQEPGSPRHPVNGAALQRCGGALGGQAIRRGWWRDQGKGWPGGLEVSLVDAVVEPAGHHYCRSSDAAVLPCARIIAPPLPLLLLLAWCVVDLLPVWQQWQRHGGERRGGRRKKGRRFSRLLTFCTACRKALFVGVLFTHLADFLAPFCLAPSITRRTMRV